MLIDLLCIMMMFLFLKKVRKDKDAYDLSPRRKIPELSFKEYINRSLLIIPFWSAIVKYFKRVY